MPDLRATAPRDHPHGGEPEDPEAEGEEATSEDPNDDQEPSHCSAPASFWAYLRTCTRIPDSYTYATRGHADHKSELLVRDHAAVGDNNRIGAKSRPQSQPKTILRQPLQLLPRSGRRMVVGDTPPVGC